MTTQPLANVTPLTAPPARISLLAAMASKYSMEPETFKNVIKQTVMPAGATNEQMAAFLLVAHEYDLNPITKEIYAFPAKGGGVTPMVGIDGWINLAQRRAEFDGMEHEWAHDEKGECVSCTCRIWRKDRTRPVVVTEFMVECKRQTDPWRSHPRRMLRHRATVQAIRYAFGFAGIKDEDDAEVIYTQATVIEQAPVDSQPARARLMAQAAAQASAPSEPTDPPPTVEEAAASPMEVPEWPQANADGELVDVRGLPWIEGAHSDGRTCTADGQWRRKRGVDPTVIEKKETALLARLEPDMLDGEPEPMSEFEKVRQGLENAADEDEMNEWWDYSREVIISASQRFSLESVAALRQKQWASAD